MKKMIMIAAAVIAIAGVGCMVLKGRFGMNFGSRDFVAGQIVLANDSSDKISVQYGSGDKKDVKVLSPREEAACGAQGFVRIFTSDKSGSYEVTYPSDQKARKLALSQVVKAAKNDKVDEEVFTEKGMVGDIKITYEEPLELAATY